MILAAKSAMTLATLCFAIGYAARRRDNRLHRRMMLAGLLAFAAAGAVVIGGITGWQAEYRPAYWLIRVAGSPERAHWVPLAHGILAGVTLLVLGAQAFTGIRRDPLHVRIYPYALLFWLFTYVSAMFIFT